MTTDPATFPQHATKERPRTIAGVIEDNAGMEAGQLISLISAAFPQATFAEVNRALEEHEERLRAETADVAGEAEALATLARRRAC